MNDFIIWLICPIKLVLTHDFFGKCLYQFRNMADEFVPFVDIVESLNSLGFMDFPHFEFTLELDSIYIVCSKSNWWNKLHVWFKYNQLSIVQIEYFLFVHDSHSYDISKNRKYKEIRRTTETSLEMIIGIHIRPSWKIVKWNQMFLCSTYRFDFLRMYLFITRWFQSF